MEVLVYSDTILISLSIFMTTGYHAYLWRSFKKKPSNTTVGIDSIKRKSWFLALKEGDEKKGMFFVQTMRNTLMVSILAATISILVVIALAAFTNNAFNASNLFTGPFFGTHSSKIFSLKYGAPAMFLLLSFLCNSLAVSFLIDANFLINASYAVSGDLAEHERVPRSSSFGACGHTQRLLERGFLLALFGNRLLCITFPLILWMFGTFPMLMASAGMVWVLYGLDFANRP